MSYIHYYKPIEVAFYYWTANHPNSFHPCDNRRFYEFVTTLHCYERQNKKWRNEPYFSIRCKDMGFVNEIDIHRFYDKMMTILLYLDAEKRPIKTHLPRLDDDHGCFYAVGVIDGVIRRVPISEDEYRRRKVNRHTFDK